MAVAQHHHHMHSHRQGKSTRAAYLCIMAWRSRSAAPDDVPPVDEVMVGEREDGVVPTLSVERVGITLEDLMRR